MVVLPLIYFLYYHNVGAQGVASSSAEESPSITSRGHLEVPDSGKSDAATDFDWRIWGGDLVRIEQAPYAVLYGWSCGGSIIAPNWVITAAHCNEAFFVHAGSEVAKDTFEYSIKRHVYHPGWSGEKNHFYDYDYQLLELVVSIPVTIYTKPIAIGGLEDINAHQLVTVSGWGHSEYEFNLRNEDSHMSEKLRQVSLTVIEFNNCETSELPYYGDMFDEPAELTSRMFCAKGDEGSTCYGDSGSGVVANGKLVGLVSWGLHCEPINVFANVVIVKDWIGTTTGLPL